MAHDREKAKQAAYLINEAFDWREAPQGMEYWSTVYSNLIKESKEHCLKCGQEVKDAS